MDHTSAEELERACRRAGARLEWRACSTSGVPVARIVCRDGWHAAALLVELAHEDVGRESVRAAARELATGCASAEEYARRVFDLVRRYVRFEREKGEIFQGPARTLATGVGDCDCHARLVYALLAAGGVPARLAFLHNGGGPKHVLAQAGLPGGWAWLETTCDARFGEDPVTAATRLGILRRDIASGGRTKVRTMGELHTEGYALEQGLVYRMLVRVLGPKRDPELVAATICETGLVGVRVFATADELPVDWPEAQLVCPEAATCAWIEAGCLTDMVLPATLVGRASLAILSCVYGGRAVQTIGDGEVGPSAEVVVGPTAPTSPRPPAPPAPTPASSPPPATIPKVPHLDGAFFVKLVELGRELGVDARDLALVMMSESGLRPDVPNRNKHGTIVAVGLNQFSTVGEENLIGGKGNTFDLYVGRHGITAEGYNLLDASKQMTFVAQYFRDQVSRHPDAKDARDLYWLNFLPASYVPGADDDHVLTRAPSILAGNPGLVEPDGTIRARGLRRLLDRAAQTDRYRHVLQAIDAAEAGAVPDEGGIGVAGVAIAVGTGLALAAAAAAAHAYLT